MLFRSTALDISFANKWSLSVINYEHWVQLPPNQKLELARSFALDAFQFGQAACSSPRCVVWLNENNLHLDVESFWGNVTEVLSTVPFDFSAVDFVNKLVESDLLAQEKLTMKVVTSDNRITRLAIEADHLHKIVESIHQCDAGFFFECSTNTLEGMFLKLDRKLQTVASAGVSSERWRELFEREQLQCFDRIVPIGSALDFSPTWDGFQLFNEFLRFVHIAPMK